MPYIKSGDGRREALQQGEPALNAGELNYQIFYYTKHNYPVVKKVYKETLTAEELIKYSSDVSQFVEAFLRPQVNYQRYNDLTGCLMRCAKEIERRLGLKLYDILLLDIMRSYDDEIVEYENKKILENSDVE